MKRHVTKLYFATCCRNHVCEMTGCTGMMRGSKSQELCVGAMPRGIERFQSKTPTGMIRLHSESRNALRVSDCKHAQTHTQTRTFRSSKACRKHAPMAMIAEILYCWAKFENWRDRKRQRKDMHNYTAASQDLIYFRPVDLRDLHRIKKLEVLSMRVYSTPL